MANYNSPPVVEVVLGVQFAPLPSLKSAHIGWYWRQYLAKDWPKVEEASRLEDQFEEFGDKKFRPSNGIVVRTNATLNRMQFLRADAERMIQIQDTRFIYNWKKGNGPYPSYDTLLPEYLERLDAFRQFIQDAQLGPLILKQWELVYVNTIAKGELWTSPSDWDQIFPGLWNPDAKSDKQRFETLSGEWHFVLGKDRGRLRATIRHGMNQETHSELLSFQLIARGRVSDDTAEGMKADFDFGHSAIKRTFDAMTSDKAHAKWGRS